MTLFILMCFIEVIWIGYLICLIIIVFIVFCSKESLVCILIVESSVIYSIFIALKSYITIHIMNEDCFFHGLVGKFTLTFMLLCAVKK